MKVFARLAAVLVGMANLILLAGFERSELNGVGGSSFFWWTTDVVWSTTIPFVLVAAIAGLVTSEVILRKLGPHRETFLGRYKVMVPSLCLGGVLMGWLIAALVVLGEVLSGGSAMLSPFALLVVPVYATVVGVPYGFALGVAEGLILGLPLAAILGLFVARNQPPSRATAPMAPSR